MYGMLPSVPCLRSLHRISAKRCAAVQNAATCLRLRYWQSTDILLTPCKHKAVSTAQSFFFALVLKGCRSGRIIHDGLDLQCCTTSTLRPFVLKPINIRLSQYTNISNTRHKNRNSKNQGERNVRSVPGISSLEHATVHGVSNSKYYSTVSTTY